MGLLYHPEVVPQTVEKARCLSGRKSPFATKVSDVKAELRVRRKLFLGSDVLLADLFCAEDIPDEKAIVELSRYLSSRTVLFLKEPEADEEEFYFRFYQLSLYALLRKGLVGSCVDDILYLADILASSYSLWLQASKVLLPEDMVGEMFDFIETYNYFCDAYRFTDAVLIGLCVLLGVLEDPVAPATGKEDKHE